LLIRIATQKDAATLAVLGAKTFAETFLPDNRADDVMAYVDASFTPQLQARELAAPGVWAFIAECDGEAVGYAKLQRSEAPDCVGGDAPLEIARIYVAAAFHGRGVGAALMNACLEKATALGADTIWLGVWERNERALGFYRRFGFDERGDHVFLLGSDPQRDLIMARPIEPPGDGR
jgi:ribosomal protein S18 acetylase RimI-like enzyme